ncbi:MAG: hypothetical protein JO012_12540 [Hyphomicrobiales bacterium]|nr:hypothetical protein [Hyphomicrobiales bacterium]
MSAQDDVWPMRPVRLVAPSGPGGNPDVLARLLADKFGAAFGRPFVVENMPGAGGVVAANMVAKAAPDGHVLMFGDSGSLAINPALNPSLGYDPIKDFTPITALVTLPTNPGHPSRCSSEIACRVHRAREVATGRDEIWICGRRFDPSSHVCDLR